MALDRVQRLWRKVALAMIYGDPDGKPYSSDAAAYRSVYTSAGLNPSRVSVFRLRHNPTFQSIYAEEFERFRDSIVEEPLALKQAQVRAKASRLRSLYAIVEQRAQMYALDPRFAGLTAGEIWKRLSKAIAEDLDSAGAKKLWKDVSTFTEMSPGGGTGFVVRQEEASGVVNYKVDVGLMREISALEAELLELTGQAPTKKIDMTTAGKALPAPVSGFDLGRVPLDKLDVLHDILSQCTDPEGR